MPTRIRTSSLRPLQYLATQILVTHPLLAPIWIVGLVMLLRRPLTRFLGIAYLALIVRDDRAARLNTTIPETSTRSSIAAGAVAIERWTARARFGAPRLRATRWPPASSSFRC